MNGFISLKKSLRIYKKVLFRKENIIIFAQLSSKEFLIYCITSKIGDALSNILYSLTIRKEKIC